MLPLDREVELGHASRALKQDLTMGPDLFSLLPAFRMVATTNGFTAASGPSGDNAVCGVAEDSADRIPCRSPAFRAHQP